MAGREPTFAWPRALILIVAAVTGLVATDPPRADTAAALNPEIVALGDNAWKKLTLRPSSRRLCHGYLVDPADTAQAWPQSRVQTGIQVGVYQGKSYLFYFGGGHVVHPCNDVELFDVATGVWTQASFPESPASMIFPMPPETSGASLTFPAYASSTEGAYVGQFVVSGEEPGEYYAITAYNGKTRVALLNRPWSSKPPATIWLTRVAGALGASFYGGSGAQSPLGHPYTEHLQDYYKWDPINERWVGISGAGTYAFSMATKTWSVLAGPYHSTNKVSPTSAIAFRSMLHFDPDLYAAGGSGFTAITADPTLKVWTLDRAGVWTLAGLPKPPGINYSNMVIWSAYMPELKKHFVYFSSYGTARVDAYLYDAVAKRWSERMPEVPSGLYSMDYDTDHKRLIAFSYGPGSFTTYVADLSVTPSVWRLQPLPTGAPPPQPFGGTLGGYFARYDPVHKAMLFQLTMPGSGGTGGATSVWAYRYRAPGSKADEGLPAPSPR